MIFTLNSSLAKCDGKNTRFGRIVKVMDEMSFKRAILYDHLMAEFTSPDVRRKDCFVQSDVLFGDIDNEKATKESEFVTLEDIVETFKGVEVWIATSKSHMIEKGGNPARPKFHLYFPLGESISDVNKYESYLRDLMVRYPHLHFDEACKNGNRLFFATVSNTQIKILKGESILRILNVPEPVDEFRAFAMKQASITPRTRENPIFEECVGLSDGRKAALYRYACSCKARGLSDEEMLMEGFRLNATFNPPQTKDEVEKAVRSASHNSQITRGEPYQTKTTSPLGVVAAPTMKNIDFSDYTLFIGEKKWVYVGDPTREIRMTIPNWVDYVVDGIEGEREREDAKIICRRWLEDTTKYLGVELNFSHTGDVIIDGHHFYNLFKGFDSLGEPKSCDLFLEHIRSHLCKDDESLYKYIMSWMADIIQHPNDKPGVALAIQGVPGTGKTSISAALSKLFKGYVAEASSIEAITSRFNRSLLEGKLLTVCDEGSAGKADYERLKAVITDKQIATEEKNSKNRSVRNCTRFIITRNLDKPFPVNMGSDDRRWAILTIPQWGALEEMRVWLIKMWEQLDNGGFAALYNLLKDWHCVDVRNIPDTEERREEIQNQVNLLESYYDSCVGDEGLIADEDNFFRGQSGGKMYILWSMLERSSGEKVPKWQKIKWMRSFLTLHPCIHKGEDGYLSW